MKTFKDYYKFPLESDSIGVYVWTADGQMAFNWLCRDNEILRQDVLNKINGDEVNLIPEITDIIENQCEPFDHKKVITQIPTKNGAHLLVRPFNIKKFGELTQKISTEDIKKHALTILYIP